MSDSRVLVVNVQGGAEFTSITEAIKAAVDGDTVQVHMGKYDEVMIVDRAVTVIADPSAEPGDVAVLGGAVITADGTIRGLSFLQMIDVRQGNPKIDTCDISLGADGIRVCTGCSTTVVKSKIHDCGAQSGGDGVYVQEGARATLEDTEVFNQRVNGVHCNGGEMNVTRCKVHDCAFGIYYRKGGKGAVANNAVEQCSRFGVYIVQASDPQVTGNTISNCGISGIMVSSNGAGSLKSNTVHGNVRILAGCTPLLGENTLIGGTMNDETSVAPSAPAVAAMDRKQSVAAR